jgi:hypothetical protein
MKRIAAAMLSKGKFDLHSDRKTVVAMAKRRSCRWQAVQRSDAGPHTLIEIRYLGAIDVELPGISQRVIVREGHARHRRAQHYVHLLEQRQPAGTQHGAHTAFSDPLGMAHHLTAQPRGCQALIVGR